MTRYLVIIRARRIFARNFEHIHDPADGDFVATCVAQWETEKWGANGRKRPAERASIVKRYIDISRLIVLAISHARTLHLAKEKNQATEKNKYNTAETRLNDMSISLSLVHIPQIIIIVIMSALLQVITWTWDSWRGCIVPQHVQDRRRGQSARRSDRLQFPRRRKTAAIHAPLLFGILEVRPGDGIRSTPCRFAPRLVAPNHNEMCQGAYLRGHLKSDFYLRACRHRPSFALFSTFLFFPSDLLLLLAARPRQDITPWYLGTNDLGV